MIPSAGRSSTSPSISAFIPVLIHLFTRLLSQYLLINPHSGTGLSGVLGAGTPVSSTLWAWSCALLYEAMRASWGPRARGLGSRVPQTGCDSQPGPHQPQRPVLAPPRGQHAAGVWGQDTLRGCSESTARPCSHSHPGLPGPESTVGGAGGVHGGQKPQPCLLDKGRGTGSLAGACRPMGGPCSPGAQGSSGAGPEGRIHRGTKAHLVSHGKLRKNPISNETAKLRSQLCPPAPAGRVRVASGKSVPGGSRVLGPFSGVTRLRAPTFTRWKPSPGARVGSAEGPRAQGPRVQVERGRHMSGVATWDLHG